MTRKLLFSIRVAAETLAPRPISCTSTAVQYRATLTGRMKRRWLLALIAAVFAPRPWAQSSVKIARVAILSAGHPEAAAPSRSAFLGGMKALGWVERVNLVVDERYASARMEDLPRLAGELLQLKPDLVVCIGPAPALAVKSQAGNVPIVFIGIADPIGIGLAKSLPRPESNATGLATLAPESILAKQVELLRETVSRASRIAFLTNPGNPVHVQGRDLRLKVAMGHGLVPIEVQAKTREELEVAFAEAARQRADFMYLSGDPMPLANAEFVAALALKHRLPVMFLFRKHVEAGGLMSYGTDVSHLYRRAASYVDKILKGTPPRDLPIEEPTTYQLVINLKTARALGLIIPPAILLRADEVIE